MNIYRSIGGRANTSGVERIDRDGQMEKLQMGEAEVTPHERMQWNAKCKKDKRGNVIEDIYDVQKDESHGNSMSVDSVSSDNMTRTRLPRPHQYSYESRLVEQRGEKVDFPKSEASKEEAYGIREGMALSENDTRNFDMKEAKKSLKENDEKRIKSGKISTSSCDRKIADAFVKVARIVSNGGSLEVDSAVDISEDYNLPVEDVLVLEKVAMKNPELVKKYASCPLCVKRKKKVPGVVPEREQIVEDGIQKESEPQELDANNPKHAKKLKEIALETGL